MERLIIPGILGVCLLVLVIFIVDTQKNLNSSVEYAVPAQDPKIDVQRKSKLNCDYDFDSEETQCDTEVWYEGTIEYTYEGNRYVAQENSWERRPYGIVCLRDYGSRYAIAVKPCGERQYMRVQGHAVRQ